MNRLAYADRGEVFIASGSDFAAGLRADRAAFWRGLVIGFLASLPIAQLAVAGELLPFMKV